MLKFSRHSADMRESSGGVSRLRSSPENIINKRPKLDRVAGNQIVTVEEKIHKEIKDEIQRLQSSQTEFESFLDMVSSDLSEKTAKQKQLKGSDGGFAKVQMFMLTKYSNRIERFRQVSRANMDHIVILADNKENTNCKVVLGYVDKHVETIGKMKRRSKQILDISDKYAVENILDNINLVTQLSQSLEQPKANGSAKMNKWKSAGFLSSHRGSVIPAVEETDSGSHASHGSHTRDISPTDIARSSMSWNSRENSGRHSKLSTFLSLKDHLAVLTKTYTGRR